VLQDGRIQQVGPPLELYRRPGSAIVAAALGPINLVSPAEAARLHWPLPASGPHLPGSLYGIRPDRVRVRPADAPGRAPAEPGPWTSGRVTGAALTGADCQCWLDVNGCALHARLGPDTPWPAPGDAVWVTASSADWIMLAGESALHASALI
jgi:ABC-type sugar transport system ATPase subunit